METVLSLDAEMLRGIVELPHPRWLNWVFLTASRVGTGGAVWLAGGLVLLLLQRIRRQDAIRLVLAIVLIHIVVDLVIKPWIDRPRPPLSMAAIRVVGDLPDTRSFPSGHAANATGAALVLTGAWPTVSGRLIVWAVALVVAAARVYLGVHYPLDAVAGCLVGFLCGWVALRIPLPPRSRTHRVTR